MRLNKNRDLYLIIIGLILTISSLFELLNIRIVWLIIFTLLTIPGFFIGQKEANLLNNCQYSNRKNLIILWLIGLVPFFFISIFFAILGSISGMVGSIHGIIILVFIIISGNFISIISKQPIVAFIYQSFLIQLLVLTQGALFWHFLKIKNKLFHQK